ncbi:hypothetical protein C9I49_05055 [Pseudomonas prosekii]|uniref:Uncharacterized protein n=1 Tax=Pseudomonas prosekii TaxID=1148509 RepID=A0A2U2DC92_9PSED|nr:hypothetical protein C9I49_05055 [Pseudomonas prosekii]
MRGFFSPADGQSGLHTNPVGVSLLAITSGQATHVLNETPLSRAGSLLQGLAVLSGMGQTENRATMLFKSTASRDNSWLAALV